MCPSHRPPDPAPDPETSRNGPPGRVDPEYADALKLFTVLSRAYAALEERSREDIRRHDLTPAEFAVLEVLYHRGSLLQGEIQRKILVSSGGITYLVDRLARRGLVKRRDCPEDRRARYAALTPAGVEFMDGIFPDHARCLEHAARGLSDQEKRQAIRLLKSLGKAAEQMRGCDEPAAEG